MTIPTLMAILSSRRIDNGPPLNYELFLSEQGLNIITYSEGVTEAAINVITYSEGVTEAAINVIYSP
jgi:hypothetical protein